MTDKQAKHFYWPTWNRCCRANGWTSKQTLRDGRSENQGLSEWHAKVWSTAEVLAAKEHVGVSLDHLRKACHVLALGAPVSSKKLSSTAVNRVVSLFKVLTDPENLSAVMEWMNPENTQRRVLISKIKAHCHEAYIRHISGDVFGTSNWEGLNAVQLLGLARKLGARTHGYQEAV